MMRSPSRRPGRIEQNVADYAVMQRDAILAPNRAEAEKIGDVLHDGVTGDISSHPANDVRRKRGSISAGRDPFEPRRARRGINQSFDAALGLATRAPVYGAQFRRLGEIGLRKIHDTPLLEKSGVLTTPLIVTGEASEQSRCPAPHALPCTPSARDPAPRNGGCRDGIAARFFPPPYWSCLDAAHKSREKICMLLSAPAFFRRGAAENYFSGANRYIFRKEPLMSKSGWLLLGLVLLQGLTANTPPRRKQLRKKSP